MNKKKTPEQNQLDSFLAIPGMRQFLLKRWADKRIRKNIKALHKKVWAELDAEQRKNTGAKGVSAPDLPNIIEFFEDEDACAVKHDEEMNRFNAEKQEQLELLFQRFGLKTDDWEGLALALAEEYVDEYRTNEKPGAKDKRWPMKVLDTVIRHAVEHSVGVNNAAIAVFPDKKDFKAYEKIRAANPNYWQSLKDDYGLR
jgi:hypothetical protein